jgi:16S rRNA (adenine1518-N6/adenine1519-N6)-dimethyltransferase
MPPGDPLEAEQGGRRPPWSKFRSALEQEGFRPTKGLGQNFLVDPNAVRSIALDSGVGPGDRVLEVGAGCGFLTLALAELGAEVLAVEIDPRLVRVARRFLASVPGVRLIEADVLEGKRRLSARVAAELAAFSGWHLVSNLPYSIAGPVLALAARCEPRPRTISVLVQAEVAQRISAQPGDSAWGTLSARLALFYRARPGRRVGAQLFWPRPRVESRVVHLEPAADLPLERGDIAAYDELVDRLFQQRRKQLGTVLADLLGERSRAEALVRGAGLDPRARPQELAPAALLELSRSSLWRARSGGSG